MSTASTAQTSSPTAPVGSPADQLIAERIAEACKALWWAEIVRRGLFLVMAWMLALLVWFVLDEWVYSPNRFFRSIAWLSLFGGSAWYVATQIWPVITQSVRPEYAARSLERDVPDLKQDLTSYVTLRPDANGKGLRDRVVRSIGNLTAGRLRSHDALPKEATGTMRWWVATAAVLAVLAAYIVLSPKNTMASASRLLSPLSDIEPAKRVAITEVQPGDAEALAGRSVAISAVVKGLHEDEKVICAWRSDSREDQFELHFNTENRRYEGDLQLSHSAAGVVAYSIVAGDDQAGPFSLNVKNLPVVAVQSVHYEPPAYTGQVPHTSSSASITAIDGTQVTVRATTNRPIARAELEFNPRMLGETIRATAGTKTMRIDDDGTTLTLSFPLRSNRGRTSVVQLESYRIRVWDDSEQTNQEPIVYPIRVIPDLAPEVAIVVPRKSPKSMGVDLQQVIEIHAMDADFGLKQVELEIRRGIDIVDKPVLWSSEKGEKGNKVTDYRFRPAEHRLRPGDVVRITAIATDNRSVPGEKSIEPNVSVTDPIEIRLVDESTTPDPQGGDDGLTEKDNRPATNDPNQDETGDPSQQSQSKDGDQQQKGTGASQREQQGSKQQGSNQASGEKDSSGEGESGKQGGESGKQGGQPDQKGTQSGQPSGQSQNSDQNNTDQGSNSNDPNGQAGEPNNANGDSAQPEAESSQGQNQQPNGGSQNQPSNDSPPNADAQPSDQKDANGAKQPGASQPQGSSGSQGNPDTQGNDGSSGQPNPGGAQNQQGNPADGSNSNGGEGGSDQGAGKHAGETFEKIRDYLEKKKQQQASKGDPSQNNPPKDQDAAQSKKSGDDREGGGEDSGAGRDNTGDGKSNQSGDPKANTDTKGDSKNANDRQQKSGAGGDSDPAEGNSKQRGDNQPNESSEPNGAPGDDPSGKPSSRGDQSESEKGSSGGSSKENPSAKGDPSDRGKQEQASKQESGKSGNDERGPSNSGTKENQPQSAGDKDGPNGESDQSKPAENKGGDSSDKGSQQPKPNTGEPSGDSSNMNGSEKGADAGRDDRGKEGTSPSAEPQEDQGKGSGESQANDSKQQSGDQGSDERQDGDSTTGSDKTDSAGNSGDSKGKNNGDGAQNQPGESKGESADRNRSNREPENREPSESKSGKSGKPSGQQSGESKQNSQANPNQGNPDSNNASQGNPQGGQSSGQAFEGGMGEGAGGDAPPPKPADLEYTKKATDMVLDYLEETRDQPDRELLEQLDWSEEDMREFADRWQKARQLDQPTTPDADNQEIREALESLGMRPPSTKDASKIRGRADDLKSIRDSGNRRPAPAAYRDIFDAFRRGIHKAK